MKIVRKLLVAIALIVLATMLAGAGIHAYFNDMVTSSGNVFAAGSLDLLLDGGDVNVVKFSVSNMVPGNQPKGTFNLTNVGTVNGYLDLEDINVTDYENTRISPETLAGDITDGVGELSTVLNLRLFVDYGNDGWISVGDNVFFNGKMDTLPSSFDLNEPINAGTSLYIVALVDWWSTPNDNMAQTDSVILDVGFELAQTTGQ